MANIRIDLNNIPTDGCEVVFRTPCDCTMVSGLIVYYKDYKDEEQSIEFTFKDGHGNDLTEIQNLFSSGVLVKALLDVTNTSAYLQNVDTNKYLETQIEKIQELLSLTNGYWAINKYRDGNNYFANADELRAWVKDVLPIGVYTCFIQQGGSTFATIIMKHSTLYASVFSFNYIGCYLSRLNNGVWSDTKEFSL